MIVIEGGIAAGKCFKRGTQVLMFDGSSKAVEDVLPGDTLMGDDSHQRVVMSITQGTGQLYKVDPVRGQGGFEATAEHILCLRPGFQPYINYRPDRNVYKLTWLSADCGRSVTRHFKTLLEAEAARVDLGDTRQPIQMTIAEYLLLPKNARELCLKGYQTGVDFLEKPTPLDPYFLGLWLGDGTADAPEVTTTDKEIVTYLAEFATGHGLQLVKRHIAYSVCNQNAHRGPGSNPVVTGLRTAGVWRNKHIPQLYKSNTTWVRSQVLAGLIDSDGSLMYNHSWEITQKRRRLAEDVSWLAKSLGYYSSVTACTKSCMYRGERRSGTYHRVYISAAPDLPTLPLKLIYKQLQGRISTDNRQFKISVFPSTVGEYHGFVLDGNQRFLLNNFTVCHNSTVIQSLAKRGHSVLPEPVADWKQELALFYEDMSQHALLLQMRILHSFASVASFPAVMERSPHASLWVFAKLAFKNGHLNKPALDCITRWSSQTIARYNRQGIAFVYLRASLETCAKRMVRRGRECEKEVSIEYMKQLDEAYNDFMTQMAETGHKIHYVDAEQDVESIATDIERFMSDSSSSTK